MRDERYTMKEIEMATGIKASVLSARRKTRGIEANADGYTLQEVKTMIKKRRGGGRRRLNPKKSDELKKQLLNDGAL